jgi:DNA (cytosine-5)-methyltransferase 1
MRSVDLFCGSGALSYGAAKAIEAVGMVHGPVVAVDVDGEALEVYRRNFPVTTALRTNAASVVDYHIAGRGSDARFAYPPELVDSRFAAHIDKVDLLVAGPPCQGHSNLNNHTRRSDPRNQLYTCAASIAIALRAKMVVIENVPDVLNDKTEVVASARSVFERSGYFVSDSVLSATDLGAAQSRKRHFLIATLREHCPLLKAAQSLKQPPMTLREAIGDLKVVKRPSFMDEGPTLSVENESRINWLFDHKKYDLPDKIRPDCHKDGHTYPSVYGRLHWDKPAQTITTGFMTPGRGRYIHPSQRRVITPREAARLQGFPDNFMFAPNGTTPSKKSLAKWIGDAVPTQLGYAAVLTALSGY